MEAAPVITHQASGSRDLTLPGPAWAMIYWPDRPNGTQGHEGRKAANRGTTPTTHRVTVRTMGTSVWEQGPAWVAENFDSVNPATSEVIGTYPVQGRSEVDAVVERARQAATWWAGLTYQQRRTRLLAWKSHITRYLPRPASRNSCTTRRESPSPTHSWRSCSRSSTSTGRRRKRAGCSARAGSGA